MVMRLFCCLLLLCAIPTFAASKLEASVDKNPVLAGEFFMLNITIDDSVKNEQPDTSSLMKDFVVGPTSLSSRTNIINGSINKQTTWSVKLMTRKEGQYTIPSFTVAGFSSQPISLKVEKRAADADKNNDIFIKTQLSSNSLYVQEAGVYTLKLYLAKELLDGSLSTPSMENAQLTQLGKQSEGYELVDGKRYLVITREYLIQPQKSGAYTIQAPIFQGRIQENYRQLEVSAVGEDQQIEIKPIPEDYKGTWLPSELVNLNDEWQPDNKTVEVGEPITRTITLTALGVTKEQLPDINMPTIDGIRSYPDKKENNNAVRDGRVVSQQTASYALLPQKPGTYTLPEVKLPWFNTKLNRISVATIPARTITVKPSSNAATPNINNQQIIDTPPAAPSENLTSVPVKTAQITYQTPTWLIVVAALGYILWIITVIIYWFTRSSIKNTNETYVVSNTIAPPSLKTLEMLQNSENTRAFYDELNNYAIKVTGQKVGAIDALCHTINSPELNTAIMQLQAQLYSDKSTSSDLATIVKILKAHQGNTIKTQQTVLKDLY